MTGEKCLKHTGPGRFGSQSRIIAQHFFSFGSLTKLAAFFIAAISVPSVNGGVDWFFYLPPLRH